MTYDREIAKVILGDDDLNGLDAFFEEVLTAPHVFKVAMARRCYNLCHVFKGNSCTEEEREVISDNALLLYADDFAQHFITYGRFPSVLLCDDILLYGRAVYNALYRMEEAVLNALIIRRVDVARRTVHEELYASVDIRVYALGNIDDVIDSLYLYKVSGATHRYGSDMLQLSRNVSEFLDFCGGANTSFLLSAQAGEDLSALEGSGWSHAGWICGDSQGLALIDGHGKRMRMVHGFVRGANREGPAWVTGFPCVESTSQKTLAGICADMSRWVKSHEEIKGHAGRLIRLLESDHDGYVGYKMSFVALLASAESVRYFFDSDDRDWGNLLHRSDIARVCRHFGKGVDLLGLLEVLLRSADKLCEWSQRLYDGSKCVGSRKIHEGKVSDSLVMRGENLVCIAGMKAENDAYDFGHRRRAFVPLSVDSAVITLGEFLDGMQDTKGEIDLAALACEMSMQHRGVNSMAYGIDGANAKDGSVSCCLKAGELATYTFPYRHRYVLSALAFLEMATRTFPQPPEQILNQFVQNLPEDYLDGVPMPAVIKDLKSNFPQYAGISFYTKKGMSRWAEVYWGSYANSGSGLTDGECERLKGPLLARAREFFKRQAAAL